VEGVMELFEPFEKAFDKIVVVEGGYSDDPWDSGKKTMYGITEVVARANGYLGSMDKMPLSTARQIYRAQYWLLLNLDNVAFLSELVAFELFDTGVNCGVCIAGKFLQRGLNVLNRNEQDYQDVRADGIIGPMTMDALRAYVKKRGKEGEGVLLRVLNALQGARYVELAEGPGKKNEKFEYGWFLNRVA
jgi:lysozyme family protein